MSAENTLPKLIVHRDVLSNQGSGNVVGSVAGNFVINNVYELTESQKQASPPAKSPLYGVPTENHAFVDRPDILANMKAALSGRSSSSGCKILALSGLGGMGKTQLMLQYCYLHCAAYDFVFWLEVDDWSITLASFHKLAVFLGFDEENTNDPEKVVCWVCSWLEARINWLLLLDNADEDNIDKKLIKLLPRIGGNIIITTRVKISSTKATTIHVDKMQPEEALGLLLGTSIDREGTKFRYARDIITELDCMPLAIALARAYVQNTFISFRKYLSMFKERKKRLNLLKYSNNDSMDTYNHTVATVWQLSFDRIRVLNPTAVKILELCTFLQPESIPVRFFKQQCTVLELVSNSSVELSSEKDAEHSEEIVGAAIAVLVKFSFVIVKSKEVEDDEDLVSDLFTVHRLVQKVIYDSMSSEKRLRWAHNIVTALSHETDSSPSDMYTYKTKMIMDMYLSHLRHFFTLRSQMSLKAKDFWNLLNRAVLYLTEYGKYHEVEELALLSIQISQDIHGLTHRNTATSVNNLARLYERQGKYDEAESLYKRALAIKEEVLRPMHPSTATSVNNLAILYKSQGKYDEAEPLYKRALAIYEKVLGPMHSHTAMSVNNLASLYKSQGKYGEAEPLYKRALAIYEEVLGSMHPHTATSMNNLAGLYERQGKCDEAEPLYKRVLAILEEVLGPMHPNTAMSVNNLAGLYSSQRKYDEAEPLYKRALAIKEEVLGPMHPDTATLLNNLANLYKNQGKYSEAEPLYKQALAIKEKVFGPMHPDTATLLNNLASLYKNQGKYDEAEPLNVRAVAIFEKALGSMHPDTATSLSSLGGLYKIQGRYDEAEPLYKRALVIAEEVLGPMHRNTARSLNNLAALYQSQGKYDEAEPLCKRVLAIFEEVLGPVHPDTATSLSGLGALYKNQCKYDEAEPLYKRALVIFEKVLGPVHPNTAVSMGNLARFYRSQGRYDEAEALNKRALAILEDVLGPTHPDTAASVNDLAALYESQNKYDEAESFYKRALATREKVLGPTHPHTAVSLNSLATLYKSLGKCEEFRSLKQKALGI